MLWPCKILSALMRQRANGRGAAQRDEGERGRGSRTWQAASRAQWRISGAVDVAPAAATAAAGVAYYSIGQRWQRAACNKLKNIYLLKCVQLFFFHSFVFIFFRVPLLVYFFLPIFVHFVCVCFNCCCCCSAYFDTFAHSCLFIYFLRLQHFICIRNECVCV